MEPMDTFARPLTSCSVKPSKPRSCSSSKPACRTRSSDSWLRRCCGGRIRGSDWLNAGRKPTVRRGRAPPGASGPQAEVDVQFAELLVEDALPLPPLTLIEELPELSPPPNPYP